MRRVRRTAEAARAAILEAAEKRLAEAGPAGIRLQEVAADVGVSHPTVLHHFGSREALVEAVVGQKVDALREELVAAITSEPIGEGSIAEMLERVFEVLGPRGHARVLTWLALAGRDRGDDPGIRAVAQAAHALRKARRTERDGRAPPFEDTYFTVLLAGLALFGDAVAGPMMRGDADDAETERSGKRFRAWLAKLLRAHLEQGG